ncbi:fha domain protein [Ophiostoma piceae UAMH 11346]|uniref:Fha domain protein n=1 Tax=Ophiostoma piceae (strain UAMH 11346) TaxID=1262450 RepID=S3CNR6_OPHP1|nr:fha domain protein [Ophiostoma piceae UAMH 11346]
MTESEDSQVPEHIANTRADSITLILKETTVDNKSDIPRRTFELSSDNKKIIIGRSSKTISKGLIPAANNGYFDSPVVSREHASIEADLDEGVVRVIDAKSLHGTSVNGNRLEAGVPFTLSNGDSLRFGAHVARALDIFHPTDCKIEIVCHQQEAARPIVERARSYCAPESVDDTSDSESSDEYDSQTDEPSGDGESLMECNTPTQTGGIKLPAEKSDTVPVFSLTEVMLVDDDGNDDDDDDDEASYEYDSEDGSSVAYDEDLGETSNEDEDEDDEEGEEDYGEEDEDDSDDADNNDFNSDLQDYENALAKSLREGAEDDGGAFLEQEIRQFMEKANQQGKILDKKLQAFATKAAQEPDAFNDVSASKPIAVPSISNMEDAHDTVMEDVSDANPNTHSFTSIMATASSAGNKKIDIPSILNPSPPSSLLSGADEILNESLQMSLPFVFASDPNTTKEEATSASTDVYTPHQQVFTQLEPPSYAAEEAAAWQIPALVTHVPVVEATPAPVAVVAPVTPFTPKETVSEPTQAKTAMKRKIDDVAAEDFRILAQTIAAQALPQTPERVMPQALLTPPAEDGPAPKRQATSLAVAAKSQTKSKAWAAVEKIGIAALGGAVVLGSLIYTAPTF